LVVGRGLAENVASVAEEAGREARTGTSPGDRRRSRTLIDTLQVIRRGHSEGQAEKAMSGGAVKAAPR
jgi:hypothetical protein